MKLAVVVQRYGLDINGGAELHARYVAERLSRHAQVEVLTTCARDYVSWRNEHPAGEESINGLTVRRFPVERERTPEDFGRQSQHVFERLHSIAEELRWLDSEGPTSPALVRFIRDHRREYDYFIFFSFRYYHAYHGFRAVPDQAVLVPTAERDGAIGLGMFGPVFRGVRALMYNSFEERAMVQAVSGNANVPHVIVGIGSEVPAKTDPGRFRKMFGIPGRFIVYVGRIDENKGCKQLFEFFLQYSTWSAGDLTLALIGKSILPIPDHPAIRHLGFLDDRDKFDAIAASDALVMPSFFESLSMVALEAWALGKPVLANGRCDVLKGQCIRSNAGLYYESAREFYETLALLQTHRTLARALGANGRAYYQRHYDWPVIERKYTDMLGRLKEEDRAGRAAAPPEPLPGWFARRRYRERPALEVVQGIPEGPVVKRERRR
ncbi:MAG: glycosyltransferase family 4 protein [Vicinamibacterales bacterium]|nr:glycosyltransferase family 4 protein [Vicinamibacterales bacterium]